MSDMYLKLDGIEGESRDKDHGGEIDVLSWSWGMSQSGSMHSGGGGGAGKVAIQDLNITKPVDKSSPTLMLKCCKGEHIDNAQLTVRKAGTTPLEYYIISLEKLIIASVSIGSSQGEESMTENVTLNFEKVEVHYQPQDATGAADGGTIDLIWNVPENTDS